MSAEKAQKIWEMITASAVGVATDLVGVIALLIVAWFVAGWVRRAVRAGCDKASIDPTLGRFFSNMARYTILVVAVISSLGVFGIETTSFAAVLGASGLAIGLAMQGSLSNFSAGVMLLLFRPFKVDDVVSVGGQTGKIEAIDLFSTLMCTPDNRAIILPNSSVFGSVIENVTAKDTRRVDVAVGVDYAASLDQTREVLTKAIADIPNTLAEPARQVVLTGLGASSVDWVVRVWCKTPDFWGVKEAVTTSVKKELDAAGIGIPFPQMDVHFDSGVSEGLSGLKKAG